MQLEAVIAGQQDSERLFEMSKALLRNKIPEFRLALEGRVTDRHRFLLTATSASSEVAFLRVLGKNLTRRFCASQNGWFAGSGETHRDIVTLRCCKGTCLF